MTGYGDIPMTVKAMKAGALDSYPSLFAIKGHVRCRPTRA